MKLLRAFIEASGYEIENVVDTKETPITKQSGVNRITLKTLSMQDSGLVTDHTGAYKRGLCGCYYLKPSLAVDYEVTNKIAFVPITVKSDEWGCIVKYVTSHMDDINADINDFGELKPLVKFMNRNC